MKTNRLKGRNKTGHGKELGLKSKISDEVMGLGYGLGAVEFFGLEQDETPKKRSTKRLFVNRQSVVSKTPSP